MLAFRHGLDEGLAKPMADTLLAKYPIEIAAELIGGLPGEVFTPPGGGAPDRIMINMHGGAFCSGAVHISWAESIPVSSGSPARVPSTKPRNRHAPCPVRAGVDASLHVFDGHRHSFFYNLELPEAQDAYETIIRFFRRHIG